MAAATIVASHAFKVVVAGSFAAGKSTLIREISDTDVVGTEAPTSGAEAAVKGTTTVGMEYGTFAVGDGDLAVELSLFGLPGQERFRFLWDIVSAGADGFLLLVDASRPETWPETAAMATRLGGHHATPLVVGINRVGTDVDLFDRVVEAVGALDAPHVACEVVDPASVREALVTVLLLVLDRLDPGEAPDPDDRIPHLP
ncbi:ATP/GTP-binding protein [Aquihabitans sp. G128]|uniref:GTP-binding protein n=1 Tax=Aquihabitans sp. G128 TaxID=2849779 RepID=UPI001C227A80|nr:ATP/GTP-binding protein [Aquihabitans sp. G128]QXC59685.1 ATP/GTP-binding protein [Aquihabitans sp. G128]